MDAREITKILIKIAGLWLLVQCLLQLGNTLATLLAMKGQDANWWLYVLASLPILIQLIVGLLMLALPGAITDTLLEKSVTPSVPLSAIATQIEGAAIAVLALYLFFRGLVDASYWFAQISLFNLLADAQNIYPRPTMTPEMFGNLVSTGAEIICAIALFFGARGLVRLRDRMRGHPYEPATAQETRNE